MADAEGLAGLFLFSVVSSFIGILGLGLGLGHLYCIEGTYTMKARESRERDKSTEDPLIKSYHY